MDKEQAGRKASCPHCHKAVSIPREDIAAGRIIGGFELRDRLGAGGMGEVWLAYQGTMDREVAVKILYPALTSDREFVENFLEEVRIAAKLEHSNIVTAFDAGVDNGIYYLAMSFVPGETLSAKIDRDGIIPEEVALSIVLQVAQALNYAWDKFSILHRDINPSNVMLTPDGHVKLMDMGISKSLADRADIQEDDLVGTPEYMSPEQAQGVEDMDIRSDIYSLGATLFQMLTGQMPFTGDDPHEVLRKQVEDPLPSPRSIIPSLSYRSTVLIEIMMAKDRDQRPGSWMEVIKDVRAVMAGNYPLTPHPRHGVLHPPGKRSPGTPLAGRRTVTVSSNQIKKVHDDHTHRLAHSATAPRRKSLILPMLLVLPVVLIGVALAVRHSNRLPDPPSPPLPVAPPAISEEEAARIAREEARLQEATEAWEFAQLFLETNPAEYDQAIRYFEAARDKAFGTTYARQADEVLQELKEKRYEAIQQVMASLKTQAEELESREEFAEAAALLTGYSGFMEEQTADMRAELAEQITARGEALAEERSHAEAQTSNAIATLLAHVAADLLNGNIRSALHNCSAGMYVASEEVPEGLQEVADDIAAQLEALTNIDVVLRESFRFDIGKDVTLTIDGEEQVLRIQGIQDQSIMADRRVGPGFASIRFTVRQLSFEDRHARLQTRIEPEVLALFAGIIHYRREEHGSAEVYFRDAGQLAEPLIRIMNDRLLERERDAIEKELLELVRLAGAYEPSLTWADVRDQLIEESISPQRAQHVLEGLEAFLERHSDKEWLTDLPFVGSFRSFLQLNAEPTEAES